MGKVRLEGRLLCRNASEAALIRELLPAHLRLSRAEPGCLAFSVLPAADPLVWLVTEEFSDSDTFEAHQRRTRNSIWGLQTAHIQRDYIVTGL